jgi:hypothetical protein
MVGVSSLSSQKFLGIGIEIYLDFQKPYGTTYFVTYEATKA